MISAAIHAFAQAGVVSAVLVSGLAIPAFAQDVRSLLSYGMTVEQARDAVRGTGKLADFAAPTRPNPILYSPITLFPVDVYGLFGTTNLVFSQASKRLVWINTVVAEPSGLLDDSSTTSIRKLVDTQVKRFGQPSARTGCEGGTGLCTMIWNTPADRVEVLVAAARGLVVVNYRLPDARRPQTAIPESDPIMFWFKTRQ